MKTIGTYSQEKQINAVDIFLGWIIWVKIQICVSYTWALPRWLYNREKSVIIVFITLQNQSAPSQMTIVRTKLDDPTMCMIVAENFKSMDGALWFWSVIKITMTLKQQWILRMLIIRGPPYGQQIGYLPQNSNLVGSLRHDLLFTNNVIHMLFETAYFPYCEYRPLATWAVLFT